MPLAYHASVGCTVSRKGGEFSTLNFACKSAASISNLNPIILRSWPLPITVRIIVHVDTIHFPLSLIEIERAKEYD